MNKSSHRLIFNASRGCKMAVAETASSCSKSPSATTSTRRKSSKCSRTPKSDGFTLLKAPPAQWIRAQEAPDLISICTVSTNLAANTVGAIGGDINITAKKVDIIEARETSQTTTEQKFKQTAITVGVSSPVISALQTIDSSAKAASKASDSRSKALATATGAVAAKNAIDAIALNPGQAGGANLNISLGTSKSQSNSSSQSSTAQGSTVSAD